LSSLDLTSRIIRRSSSISVNRSCTISSESRADLNLSIFTKIGRFCGRVPAGCGAARIPGAGGGCSGGGGIVDSCSWLGGSSGSRTLLNRRGGRCSCGSTLGCGNAGGSFGRAVCVCCDGSGFHSRISIIFGFCGIGNDSFGFVMYGDCSREGAPCGLTASLIEVSLAGLFGSGGRLLVGISGGTVVGS